MGSRILAIGLVLILHLLPRASGAGEPLEKMRFIYSAIGGSQASVWIPHEAGIFRKHEVQEKGSGVFWMHNHRLETDLRTRARSLRASAAQPLR
jgi:hypothetical protein